jgi:hypothetical protein
MESPVMPEDSVTTFVPNFGYDEAPKRALWKWSLVLTAVLLLFLLWQCGTALYSGRRLANAAARQFHEQINSAQYEEVCREADQDFVQGEKHEELLHLLAAVHGKLGDARAYNQINMNVSASTAGTFISADYNTKFAHGDAVETFTWKKSSGTLKLYSYSVQSKALLE